MKQSEEIDSEIIPPPPTMYNSRQSSLKTPGLIIKQTITYILCQQQFFICQCGFNKKIIVYDINKHQTYTIKVQTADFFITTYQPYLFACVIGQYIYLWEKQIFETFQQIKKNEKQQSKDIKDTKDIKGIKINKKLRKIPVKNPQGEVHKAKISKLDVTSLCKVPKGVFIAGNVRLSLKNKLTNKKTIYFLEKLDYKKKNKALWEIQIPRSQYPIQMLQSAAPYLVCYMKPKIYIVHPATQSIKLVIQNPISTFSILKGRYHTNTINIIGILHHCNPQVFTADIESQPIFGIQINQYQMRISCYCQTPDGQKIFISDGDAVYQFNLSTKKKSKQLNLQNNYSLYNISRLYCLSDCQLVVVASVIQKRINDLSFDMSYRTDSVNSENSGSKSDTKTEASGEQESYWCAQIIPIL